MGRRRIVAVIALITLLRLEVAVHAHPWRPRGAGGAEIGTYVGGSLAEVLRGMGVDADGNVYVVGSTGSPDFPTVPVASYDPPPPNLTFVSRLDPTGSVLLRSTMMPGFTNGAKPLGRVTDVAVDGAGNVYLTGISAGDLPILNAIQPVYGGDSDAFVVKLDAGGALAFGTYLGGGNHDIDSRIAVDPAGGVHVVGTTASGPDASPPFPGLSPSQPGWNGGRTGFVAKLGATKALARVKIVPGTDLAVATNASGHTWIAGATSSVAFPTTEGSWQPAMRPGPFRRSLDGGRSWTPSIAPLRDALLSALAAAPSDPDRLYAGTPLGAVYRSVDAGDHWALLFRTETPALVRSIAVDAGDSDTVYVTAGAVFRTRDGGVDWDIANAGPPAEAARPILVADPSRAGTVYAVGDGLRLHRSDDGGEQWTPLHVPVELASSPDDQLSLVIDPLDSDHLVLWGNERIAQSVDRGSTWTVDPVVFDGCLSLPGCDDPIRTVALDRVDSRIMYVATRFRLSRSTDGGRYWDQHVGCLGGIRWLLVDPANRRKVYGYGIVDFGFAGFAESEDGGASWTNHGLSFAPVVGDRGALVIAGSPTRLYAAADVEAANRFVVRLDDAGESVFATYAGPCRSRRDLEGTSVIAVDAAGDVFLPDVSLDRPASHVRSPRPWIST